MTYRIFRATTPSKSIHRYSIVDVLGVLILVGIGIWYYYAEGDMYSLASLNLEAYQGLIFRNTFLAISLLMSIATDITADIVPPRNTML